MKIDTLRIIEDALIGGRSGEMAYIENNPFINSLYIEYINANRGKGFKDFLKECLSEDTKEEPKPKSNTRVIKKNIKIDNYDNKFKEYKKAQEAVNKANKDLQDKKRELAESVDPLLAKVSTYEIKYHEFWQSMEFTIRTSEIE